GIAGGRSRPGRHEDSSPTRRRAPGRAVAAPAEGPGPPASAQVTLGRRGTARWRSGHPWIFRDDVSAPDGLPNGEIVAVLSPGGESLGTAFWSSVSKIALRRIAGAGTRADPGLFTSRLDAALAYRERIAEGAQALRLVSSDPDGIPGLVVDRYGEHLVVQSLTAGVDRLLDLLIDHLESRVRPA